MALKVPTLSFLAIGLILDRHERTRAPEATEVFGPGDSPAARHSGLLLPQNVVAALEKALRGSLIAGNSYHVALQPDEATALTRWCRAVAPITSSADAAVFRDAADTIDATE
jgi:hypothetical protein